MDIESKAARFFKMSDSVWERHSRTRYGIRRRWHRGDPARKIVVSRQDGVAVPGHVGEPCRIPPLVILAIVKKMRRVLLLKYAMLRYHLIIRVN
jgi:hypothetical protein